jgi:hypothetical protein
VTAEPAERLLVTISDPIDLVASVAVPEIEASSS